MIATTAKPDFHQENASFLDRENFLEALWASYQCVQILESAEASLSNRPYPKRFTNTREQFFAAARPLSLRWHAEIIGRGGAARDAVLMFLYGLRCHMGRPDDNALPMEWLALFEGAHRAGELCVMALGAAVRAVYTSCGPTPHEMGRNHERYLRIMRSVPRAALMTGDELGRFEALPEVVTLYRGSVTTSNEVGAKGISWTIDKRLARYFAGKRHATLLVGWVAMQRHR
ncbi:hypothetical protein [Sphingomonas kyeonggiensis]|uniref:hypothetical protein n=1 Tax=Sphingomonas kyeonggiensis TaxID=1268553 RepID=UPI0027D7EF0C|nr:hypothetical protein [Sphingomonas kyeonggiensis]